MALCYNQSIAKLSKEKSELLKAWANNLVYLTPEGLKKMQAKLARLQGMVPHLVSEAARTAAYGDRSENAEYKDAKATLRRTYRQISGIEDQLKRVKVIEPDRSGSGKIQIGSTVVVESQKGVKKTFQILGAQESDPSKGRISHQSPMGSALLSHSKGDSIVVKGGSGVQTYKIIEVR